MNTNQLNDKIWVMPGWGHAVYAVGGLLTVGLLWACWLVNILIIEIHNAGVYRRQKQANKLAWEEYERAYYEWYYSQYPHEDPQVPRSL